jgi:negative elongation factor E
MIKRPSDARDAREVARKLLKSGSIQPILKPALKQDQTSFKRPKGQERKRIHSDNSGSVPYQPFSNVPATPETPEKDSP